MVGNHAVRRFERDRCWREVVTFLRRWLPWEAKLVYREMMRNDPDGWYRDPHFAGGIIIEHALRGNGIDERVLGVESLDDVWPALLQDAVDWAADDLASA